MSSKDGLKKVGKSEIQICLFRLISEMAKVSLKMAMSLVTWRIPKNIFDPVRTVISFSNYFSFVF